MPRRSSSEIDPTKPERVRKGRKGRRALESLVEEVPKEPMTGPRPARSALEAAKSIHYEPPYESPALEVGQRAEHPEYDTGHVVARPADVIREEDEAA
jgi:hypothetical protein